MDLSARVAEFVRRYGLDGTAGVVAISGGPDSVALAHALTRLLREGRLGRLVLGHVNHRLRGAESDEDEAFVVALQRQWQPQGGPTLQFVRLDTAQEAKEHGQNLEACAREQRYGWLTDLARQEGASWVATGHTADDQAETVLFRLLRGTGLAGLAGMAELRSLAPGVELVRPLLSASRREVLAHLDSNGLAYRTDRSNQDLSFSRNRIRHELLPRLATEHNPAVVDVLCRLAGQAAEVQREIEARAAELLERAGRPRAGDTVVIDAATMKAEAPHVVREAFRLLWRREGWAAGEMGFDDWQRLADVAAGRLTAWDFPGGVHARRAREVINLHHRGTERHRGVTEESSL